MVQRLQISSYDPRWVLQFEAERDRIAQALGELACRIDHNGSTAVRGLEAKPIIDIQVSAEQLRPIRAYAEPLATLGYVHVPHVDDAICPSFIDQGNGRTRTIFTSFNPADRKSDVLWHSVISCVSTATSHGTTPPSRSSWLCRSTQRTLRLAKRTRTQKASLSTAWFRLHWRRDTWSRE